MKSHLNNYIVLVLVILVLFEGRAHAYIDPGTGSLIWQLLFSAAVGTLFYLRKVFVWFRTLRERRKADGAHYSTGTPSSKSEREAGESPPLSREDG
jgi:hypothetical protein